MVSIWAHEVGKRRSGCLGGFLVDRIIDRRYVPIFAEDVSHIRLTSFWGVLADDNFAQNTTRYGNIISGYI
jgi:hypothetical protein